MRMMLKIKMPTELGNRAIKDGSLGRILEDTVGKLKAKAAYFVAEDGRRCAMIFFDMKDSSGQCHGNLDSSAVGRRLASSDETDIV